MHRNKHLPLPTTQLIRSIRSVGELLDQAAMRIEGRRPRSAATMERSAHTVASCRITAATCYQAAYRLEELATLVEEMAPIVAKCDHKFVDSTACLKCGWAPKNP